MKINLLEIDTNIDKKIKDTLYSKIRNNKNLSYSKNGDTNSDSVFWAMIITFLVIMLISSGVKDSKG